MAPQDRQYQRFDPKAYQERREVSEKLSPREVIAPTGIDDILGDIDQAVTGSNLSEQYRQQGGQ